MNESAKIACCLICTLSERMKACQVCPFRVGLPIKAQQEQERKNTVFPQKEQTKGD